MWSVTTFESVLHDVRHGARLLWRTPVFTLVAVLSIGAGLAAGTGIFLVVNSVIFRPLAVGDGAALYKVYTANSGGSRFGGSSYGDYEAFGAVPGVFTASCAITGARATLTMDGISALHEGQIVSPDCFDALRVTPHLGRFFDGAAARSTASVPIAISYSLWVRRFGQDRSVIGRAVRLNGLPVTITAVGPGGFAGTSLDGGAEFWAPVSVASAVLPPNTIEDRRCRVFHVFARLEDGVEREQAEAALAVVASQLRRLDDRAWADESEATRRVTVMREVDARFADTPGGVAAVVFGSLGGSAIVVAIACVNLATMILARGASRAREIAIRLALGASRGRVIRELATESGVIATLGAGTAIGVLTVARRAFDAYRPAVLPAFDLAVDWRVVAFASVAAMAGTVLFAIGPAFHAVRLAIAEGLKGRLLATRLRTVRVDAREALIVVQVAASVALLLVSTLFVSALGRGSTQSPGFDAHGVAVVPVDLEAIAEEDVPAVTARLLEAARSVRDVETVSLAGLIPLMHSSTGFSAAVDDSEPRTVFGNIVAPGYFATLRIPLLAGRDFDARDRQDSQSVAIVSETFARSAWGTTNGVGRSLIMEKQRVEVIGIVADMRYRSLSEPFLPLVFLPVEQSPRERFFLHARTRTDGKTVRALEDAMRAVDRQAAVDTAVPMGAYIEQAMVVERVGRWAGGALGIVQLALAVLSLWGLVTYAVARRTSEMGVRLALGATPGSLVRLTMRPALVQIGIGVAIGCVAGTAIAQVVLSESVGLAPLDVMSVVPVAMTFTMVAAIAAWWPARSAGLTDPAASLRREG